MPQHEANSIAKVLARLKRHAGQRLDLRRNGPYGSPGRTAPVDGATGSDAAAKPLTTLDATIRPVGTGRYRRLGWAAGEPHLLRDDLGVGPDADRSRARRSLLYVAHHTDVHVCDAQSPARLVGGEAFGWVNPGSDSGHRPQETCTTQVLDQLVRATNAVRTSPLSGAEMACCIQSGDNTDNRTVAEVGWWRSVLDGLPLTPGTGLDGRYEGIQRSGWRAIWHPDRPGFDLRQHQGFPYLPGFLDGAVGTFHPAGLDVPWLTVFGNHDQIFQGTFGEGRGLPIHRLEAQLVGASRSPFTAAALIRAIAAATVLGDDPAVWRTVARRPGVARVTPDPESRRPVRLDEYIASLLLDRGGPGPVGHGFGPENLVDGTSWWSRTLGEDVQVLGLDTCHHRAGDDGRMGPTQTAWLEAELRRHHSRWYDPSGREVRGDGSDRLVIIVSHHNSRTMNNLGDDPHDPGRATTGPALVELLSRYPNVVVWLNGHSHEHRIMSHAHPGAGHGWWEVNTASGIDFGQQGRTVELFANGDGTLSVVVTVLDHAADPAVPYRSAQGWTPPRLASMSRELAANDDRWFEPLALLGGFEDRNVELPLRAPFPV
ncbi:MAG: TIGR03767 family metallophosphoesterase [Acidimicrobiales bacterium]|nr:TIGR03767 family metallophosphoesterase [Acidimicrobiales bacterium]